MIAEKPVSSPGCQTTPAFVLKSWIFNALGGNCPQSLHPPPSVFLQTCCGAKQTIVFSWKLEIRTKICRKPKANSLISIIWFDSSNNSLFVGMTLTLHKFRCDAVLSLQFTHFAFGCKLRNLRAVCFTVGLYCVPRTWQQIFEGSLQVAEAGVFQHVTVEHKHLGR